MQPVSVRLRDERPTSTPIQVATPWAQGVPDGREELEPLRARDLYLGQSESRVRQAESNIEQQRERAYRAILAMLERQALARLQVDRDGEQDGVKAEFLALLQRFFDSVRAVFEAHAMKVADQRYPLTSLVGFPDPDPDSSREPLRLDPFEKINTDRAKAFRAEIARLDTEFRRNMETVLGQYSADLMVKERELAERYAVLESEARRVAEAEARRLSQAGERVIASVRTVSKNVLLARQPEVVVRIEGSRPPPQPPEVAAVAPKRSDSEALRVWMAQNGYRQAGPGESAPDRTHEFYLWLRQFQLGP